MLLTETRGLLSPLDALDHHQLLLLLGLLRWGRSRRRHCLFVIGFLLLLTVVVLEMP